MVERLTTPADPGQSAIGNTELLPGDNESMGLWAGSFSISPTDTQQKSRWFLREANPANRRSPRPAEAGSHGGCRRNTQELNMETWRITEEAGPVGVPSLARARLRGRSW
jgi:hypothetical protein